MARRKRRRRKFNPTRLETALIAGGTMVIGGIGGFLLSSWGCRNLLQSSLDQGFLQPGPNMPPGSLEGTGAAPTGGY